MEEKNLPAVTKKMTLEEYQEKAKDYRYSPLVKPILVMLVATIGIGIVSLLVLVVIRLFDVHEYAGYAGIAVAVLLFIFFYLVPIIKIHKLKPFIVNVDKENLKKALKHNKENREKIADHFIDITAKTEGLGWYSKDKVGNLAIARNTKDDTLLKNTLTDLYQTDVKKNASNMITKSAVRIGVVTALSQSERLDTLLVATLNLKLIKDILYLYGFRPTDEKLIKIYRTVLVNSLIAYGASAAGQALGKGLGKSVEAVAGGIPFLGNAIATVVGSVAEGVINGFMTVVIGNQTVKYLKEEYHLQDILDGVEIPDVDEQMMMESVKTEIVAETKKPGKVKPA